jgi:hypothetical protein
MMKKMAIVLALLMLVIVVWGLFFEGSATRIIINGQELAGPLQGAVGAGGAIVGSIAFLCAAIFLAFIFAGFGLFILGCVVVVGLVMAWFLFPVLLFLLIPLAIVWAFVAAVGGTKI